MSKAILGERAIWQLTERSRGSAQEIQDLDGFICQWTRQVFHGSGRQCVVMNSSLRCLCVVLRN